MKACVLSGGARKGAYQAGVLKALAEAEQAEYDLYAGVSCGALAAYFMAQGHTALEFCAVWMAINTPSVYRTWGWFGTFIGWVIGIFRGSLYDSRPLLKMIRSNSRPLTKQLRVGIVDLETGAYDAVQGDQHETAAMTEYVWASCAQPLIMTPLRRDGYTYTDGGVRNKTPLAAAIDAGATKIDVIMTTPLKGMKPWKPTAWWQRWFKLFARTLREIDIAINEAHSNDLARAKLVNAAVLAGAPEGDGKRYIELRIFAPAEPLDVIDFEFDPAVSEQLIEQGYNDAMKILETT